MIADDARLVAALIMLADRLGPIVDDVLAGQLDQDDRRLLARALLAIAGQLAPETR